MTTAQYEQYQESLSTIEMKEVVKTAELDVRNKIASQLKKLGVLYHHLSINRLIGARNRCFVAVAAYLPNLACLWSVPYME